MVDEPAPTGVLERNKPLAVMNYDTYKIAVNKSHYPLAYYSFQRKSLKRQKKLFFCLFDLALVNAQIL
jgi:hypothetical protein